MRENQRKEKERDGKGRGGNLKLSRWIEAVIFHPADFLPPLLGDRVGGGDDCGDGAWKFEGS